MKIREENNVALWVGVVPSHCKYVGKKFHVCCHDGNGEQFDTDDYQEAEDKFIALSGGKHFEPGKTVWRDGKVNSVAAIVSVAIAAGALGYMIHQNENIEQLKAATQVMAQKVEKITKVFEDNNIKFEP